MIGLTKVPLNEYGHVMTKDGSPVKILCADVKHATFEVVGIIQVNNTEEPSRWTSEGSFYGEADMPCRQDLIPVPKKHVRWAYVNNDGSVAEILYTDEEKTERNYYKNGKWVRLEIDESQGVAA